MKKMYLFTLMLLATFGISNLTAQTLLFGEDFGGGAIPATWTNTDNNLDGQSWQFTTVGSVSGEGLTSTTAANGFIMFDSDALGGTATGENVDLVTNSFSTLGETTVRLQFQEFFRQFAASEGIVSVSTDGGTTWDEVYSVGLSLAQNAATPNPNIVDIDISADAANAANVQLKFNYVGDFDYYWFIDDIFVYAPAAFDVAIDSAYLSEYSAIPQSQAGAFTPAVGVTNLGASTATNVTVDVNITDGTNNAIVFTTSMTQASLASGAATDLVSATSFTPSGIDFYIAEFIVTITEADAVAANDTFRTIIDITDSLYARDFAYIVGVQNGVTQFLGIGAGDNIIMGNVFDITTATDLVSIQAFINASVGPGDTVNARLYNFAANTVGSEIAMQERIFTAADTPVVFMEFTFNESLAPGQYYMAIEETNTIDNISLWFADNIYTPNRSKGSINGGPFADFEDLGFRNVPLIRANLFTPIQDCEELIISEIIEGTGSNKCLELYNPTAAAIDLSAYSISVYNNGNTLPNSTTTLAGTIPANGTFVICNSGATILFTDLANATNFNATTGYNGDDVIELLKGTQTIDIVGELGNATNFNLNQTLVRNEDVLKGDTDGTDAFDATAWTFLPQNDVSNLGIHFSDCNPVCRFDSIVAGTQTACVNTNNEYTQELLIYFNNAPASGSIDVNGEIVAFTTSPLTITLTGLDSDGNDVDVTAFFTDDNACTFTETAAFTAPDTCLCPTIMVTVNTTDVVNCATADGTITTTVSGGASPYSYDWTPTLPDAANHTGLAAATYDVEVTDDNGCTGNGSGSIANPSGSVALTLDLASNPNCDFADGQISVTTTGGATPYTYSWLGSTETTEDLSGLGAGTYTLTVTDANNCTASLAAVTLTAPPAINVVIDSTNNVTCNGANDGEIYISISGGVAPYSTVWVTGATTEDLTGLAAGAYNLVQVTDFDGCSVSNPVSATITEPTSLTVTLDNSEDVSCNGLTDGEINMSVSGGVAPLTYSWLGSTETTEDLAGLGAGSYTLTATDAGGCTGVSNAVTISEPAAITVNLSSSTTISCNGFTDGEIDMTVSGGVAPLTYAWLGSTETTEDLTGLGADTYTLTVTDADGCSASSNAVILSEPTALSATTISTDESTSGAADGTAGVTVSGGTYPYTYVWTGLPSETSDAIENVSAGSYEVTVTDANGCAFSETIIVDLASGIRSVVSNSFNIYPNPAVRNVNIEFDVTSAEEIRISLVNTIGKVVYAETIQANGSFTKTIDVSEFAAGIYMLELSNADGKLVKMLTVAK